MLLGADLAVDGLGVGVAEAQHLEVAPIELGGVGTALSDTPLLFPRRRRLRAREALTALQCC